MKEITKLMINEFRIKKIGYDFMGYTFVSPTDLSFHHLLVPKDKGGKEESKNGAILVRKTAHDYLHIIEKYDREIFDKITLLMIKENISGKIDLDSIKYINELLLIFEEKHKEDTFKNGTFIIKDIFKERFLNKRVNEYEKYNISY